ncbi:MAG: hypothetical protein Kow00108_25360 [Calditrichia bacterium]
MWYIYIIYSHSIDKFYVGYSDDPELRLKRHNMGWGRFTKRGIPWESVYLEKFDSKSGAIKREREIKKMKSRSYIENLIKNAGGRPDSSGSLVGPV